MMIEVRRGAARSVTRLDGLVSRHSFAFGEHYDADNVGFGLLTVHNDDILEVGAGYDTHEHREVEIVTWVLDGVLRHQDSLGNHVDLWPGTVAVASAGAGIHHSERNGSRPGARRGARPGGSVSAGSLRFVQAWLRPGPASPEPTFAWRDVSAALDEGGLVVVATGRDHRRASLRLGQLGATLHVGRLSDGEAVTLPSAPALHLYVARGSVEMTPVGSLGEGDAARIRDAAALRFTAAEASEVLVWAMCAPVANSGRR